MDALAWVVWAASFAGFVALFVFYLRVARRQLRAAKSRAGYSDVKAAQAGLTRRERWTVLRAIAKQRPLPDERLAAAASARARFQIKMSADPAAHWYRDIAFIFAAQLILFAVGERAAGSSDPMLVLLAGFLALEGFTLQWAVRRGTANGAEWLRRHGGGDALA